MDFFVFSRDAPGTALRDDMELLERHWSYMDGFAETMIARGPTLTADRATATGSIHVLGLPSAEAAQEFVHREPNNRAGVYAEHALWRFDNLLGRTMWEFSGTSEEPRFLVIARLDGAHRADNGDPLSPDRLPQELRERLILYGALRTPDGTEPIGCAAAIQAFDREMVAALLADARTGFVAYQDVEIHDWESGGRR
jgi:uncharacterized protein YciI